MSQKTVFISYRRDATGKSFARLLKQELTHRGYDVFLDVDSLDAGYWKDQILTQVPKRAHFLLLLTPGALDRCADENDWVRREFLLALRHQRNIVPVREESVDIETMRGSAHESMQPVFAFQIAGIQHSTFESDIEKLISRFIALHMAPAETTTSVPVLQVDISRIIKYAPAELIGREIETQLLNDAWNKAIKGEAKRPHVLTIVALGGEGKTSLVAKWAANLAGENWPGCEAVFAWSFYSQGTKGQTTASSDLFLKEALVYFGDAEMASSARHASDKGKRLAQIIGARRALLILDGVEPLQYPPTSPMPGELKDHGLATLLKGLAATNHGLCVLTTRYSISDLKVFWQTTAPETKLPRLSQKAGVALLKLLGVQGTQKEFEKLVEDVQGHALTLNLLGSYLHAAHAGDIRKRDLVKLEEADNEQGGHAFRVIDAYVQWFENGGKNAEENKKGQRALAVLRLLGLFDRPAPADCFVALLKAPAIPNLTEVLAGKNKAQRNVTLTQLETAKLITVNRDAAGTLLSLDAHPLLREFFAKKLREQHPVAWRAAHQRIYQHLCANTQEGEQPTLEELQPLYQAVTHGCLAGLQQDAFDKIFYKRLDRQEAYVWKKLGAFGTTLGCVACFFEQQWDCISPALKERNHVWLLNEAAVCLRALARLTEAIAPARAGLEICIEHKQWGEAARLAHNLGELELMLGEMGEALRHTEQSVIYADRDDDSLFWMASRATHADTLHQAGRRAEAEARFHEAKKKQDERQPDFPLLYSTPAFRYCDLLLAAPERAAWQTTLKCGDLSLSNDVVVAKSGGESPHSQTLFTVSQGAAQMLKVTEKDAKSSVLDTAFDHITLGRTALYAAILDGSSMTACHESLEYAVDGFRRSGNMDDLPSGLLTRAWLRSLEGNHIGPESAKTDLDEAWEIAERGPMPLYMADIHLHRARLFFRVTPYPWNNPDGTQRNAKDDLADARRLIEKHGYGRRKEELEDAERVIAR